MDPTPDLDLETMTPEQLIDEVKKLRAGIRHHRDSEGHNLCWWVPELWSLLPERRDPTPRVPPVGEFLENCAKYRGSLEASALIQPMTFVPGKGLCFTDPESIAEPRSEAPESPVEFIETSP